MAKKLPHLGAIIRIPLDAGSECLARVYRDSVLGVFTNYVACQDVALLDWSTPSFFVAAFTGDFKSAGWSIVGNVPFSKGEETWAPPTVARDILSGKPRVYHQGKLRDSTEDEVRDMEKQCIFKPEQLIDYIKKRIGSEKTSKGYPRHRPSQLS